MKKREVCQSLLRLRDALNAIAYTGLDIGHRMTTDTFRPDNEDALREFIDLLEEQNQNLSNAAAEFKALSTIFEIQIPELNPLIVHIRGKSDRIELIYSVASSVDLRRRLEKPLAAHEKSKFLGEPRELSPVVTRGRGNLRIEPYGRSREADDHFHELVDYLPVLDKFIKAQCDAQYLK